MSRPPFKLGAGGCSCASCKYTREFIGKPFSQWPRGNPAGRRSAAAYAAHVAHAKAGASKAVPFTPGQAPQFSTAGLVMPIPLPSALVRDFVAAGYRRAEKQTPAEAGAARPVDPGKDRQHFREPDRRPEACKLYAMPQPQYMTVADAAKKWKCSKERIWQWLATERIKGAAKVGRDWLIPAKAERPEAERPYAFTKRKAA